MGSKNNPKNRTGSDKKKMYNGKEVEPIVFYDTEKKKKYISVKYAKTSDIILDDKGNPIKWDDIAE